MRNHYDQLYFEANNQYERENFYRSTYNSDWALILKDHHAFFRKLNLKDPAIYGEPTYVIADNEVYFSPFITDRDFINFPTQHWGIYLQQLLNHWGEIPNVVLAFDTLYDAHWDTSLDKAVFYRSKIHASPAPVWFEWFHLRYLTTSILNGQREPVIDDGIERNFIPVWRGSIHHLRVTKEIMASRTRLLEYMKRDVRLQMIYFSQHYPTLLDARASGMQSIEEEQEYWDFKEIKENTVWLDFSFLDSQSRLR